MKQTFKAQTFNSKTFASGEWQGIGSAATVTNEAVAADISNEPTYSGTISTRPKYTATVQIHATRQATFALDD